MILILTKKNIDSATALKSAMLTWREVYSLIIREFQNFNKNVKLREVAYKIELFVECLKLYKEKTPLKSLKKRKK